MCKFEWSICVSAFEHRSFAVLVLLKCNIFEFIKVIHYKIYKTWHQIQFHKRIKPTLKRATSKYQKDTEFFLKKKAETEIKFLSLTHLVTTVNIYLLIRRLSFVERLFLLWICTIFIPPSGDFRRGEKIHCNRGHHCIFVCGILCFKVIAQLICWW